MTTKFSFSACCLIFYAAFGTGLQAAEDSAGIEFFEQRIRPVLVQQCYECHNSLETAEGGLALDHRAGLWQGGDSGPAVRPGNPMDSRLLKVIRHEIAGQEMPEGGPKLSEEVIRDFAKWIETGAPDPRDEPPSAEDFAQATSWEATLQERKQWWSFQPLAQATPPATTAWSDHPVDRFVLRKLEASDLTPAEPADHHTLLRRLTFAITGLPPTLKQMQEFGRDDAPDRLARWTDRLLDSPQYGERWARHWMDWIRYAESHGSEGDPEIHNAWHYRDYLIRALNQDVPYDQLVREHVAGDLLDAPRINRELGLNESLLGTIHWRMVFHGFAPTDALDERVRFTDDQINAFSKAFLGLTVSCARCHDHKFDAISQADYYALFGILASCRPGRTAVELPEKLERHRHELSTLKHEIRQSLAQDWAAAMPGLEEKWAFGNLQSKDTSEPEKLLHPWHELQQRTAEGQSFADAWQELFAEWQLDRQRREQHAATNYPWRWNLDSEDGRDWYAQGTGLEGAPTKAGDFAIEPEGETTISHIFPAGTYSGLLSTKHAARFSSPDVHLDGEHTLWLRVLGENAAARYVVQDYPRDGTVYPVQRLDKVWKWRKFPLDYWEGDDIHIELATDADAPLLVKPNERGWFGIREAIIAKQDGPAPPETSLEHLDVIFEIAPNVADESSLAAAYSAAIKSAVEAFANDEVSSAQALLLDACLAESLLPNELDQLPRTQPLIETYRRKEAEIPVATRVPSLEETVGRDQPLFERGHHRRPGDPIPRRFLEAIDDTSYGGRESGRRQLAEDVLREDNPLTRRVIVNRLWHHLFGRGIVATPDNLGRLGSAPTHPELLDDLASRFAGEGWSLKRMIRFMVTSKTWQMNSTPSLQAREIDPGNTLWSHARVRRLEAEAIRDALLAVSGRLKFEQYGLPVEGDADRRSVYVRVHRNRLDPFLRVFDFPEPYTSKGRRDATNVPAQSLTMLNDPRVREIAQTWAECVLADEVLLTDGDRARHMLTLTLSRPPKPEELQLALAYLQEVRHDPRTSRPATDDEEVVTEQPNGSSAMAGAEHVWTELALAIFNFKEFIYLK